MQAFKTQYIQGDTLTPITWAQAQELMKPKVDDSRYYFAAVEVLTGAWLIDAIQKRHGAGLTAVCTVWRGWPIAVCAMKKSDLPVAEYAALVRNYFGRTPVVEDGCVDVWAPAVAMEACREMAVDLLTDLPTGGDLAMAA